MNKEYISNLLINNIYEKWIIELIYDYMKINISEIINILQILINTKIINLNIQINSDDIKSYIIIRSINLKFNIKILNISNKDKTTISKLDKDIEESNIINIMEEMYKNINNYVIEFVRTIYHYCDEYYNMDILINDKIYKLFPENVKNNIKCQIKYTIARPSFSKNKYYKITNIS
jgi:hypothetical protein